MKTVMDVVERSNSGKAERRHTCTGKARATDSLRF